eukprot:1108801-Ditylum_brightwellii.AAC.1
MDAKKHNTKIMRQCPILNCHQEFNVKKIYQHIGYHYYHNPAFISEEKTPQGMLYGMCGINPVITGLTAHSNLGCPVWIEGKTPKYACWYVPYINFSLGVAATSSEHSHCTNQPMICLCCPQEKKEISVTVIWTYVAQYHWSKAHPGQEMPSEVKTKSNIVEQEIDLLKRGI